MSNTIGVYVLQSVQNLTEVTLSSDWLHSDIGLWKQSLYMKGVRYLTNLIEKFTTTGVLEIKFDHLVANSSHGDVFQDILVLINSSLEKSLFSYLLCSFTIHSSKADTLYCSSDRRIIAIHNEDNFAESS